MMGLTWYGLGVLTFASAVFLWRLSGRYRLNGIAWAGLLLGISLVLFTVAWAVGSVLEGVPRAASMGLLCFGLSGVVLLALTWKYITARLEKAPAAGEPPTVEEGARPAASALRKDTAPATSETVAASETVATPKTPGPWDTPGRWDTFKRLIRPLAYLSLVAAFIIGLAGSGKDFESMVLKRFPDELLTKVNDDPVVFQLGQKGEGPGNYVLIQEGQGYGGPFVVGIRIMSDGKVHEVFPLDHKETPAFAQRIEDAKYRDQFIGKAVDDDFIVAVDVDAVTGATVTTMAATQAIRKGAHIAAARHFELDARWQRVPWKLGAGEILILVLFVLAFFRSIHTRKPWRYVYMGATMAITGFYLNASISISNLGALVMGYIPGVKDHLIWWVLTVGTVLAILFIGKNVYCYRICPFHGVQFVLNKISGSRLALSPGLAKRTRFIANFLVWFSLMTVLLSTNPALGAYEPFAMMFSLQGIGVQWYILPVALLGAFLMSSSWCRFFCPLGHALTNLLKIRSNLLDRLGPGKKQAIGSKS